MILIDPEQLVRRADELAALPASATRLAGMLSVPDWDVEEVVRIIRFDEALTGKLLRAANSALVAPVVEITNVQAAVMQLGAGNVITMTMAQSVKGLYSDRPTVYGMTEDAMWRHSVCSALAVEHLRQFCGKELPAEAFAAALLHDIGKLVIARYIEGPALERIAAGRAQGFTDAQAEEQVVLFNHATLGGVVASNWKLPRTMIQAINQHHEDSLPAGAEHEIVHAVQVADAVANIVAAGLTVENAKKYDRVHSRESLGLSPKDFGRTALSVANALSEVLTWYE